MISLPNTEPIAKLLFTDEQFLSGGGALQSAVPYARDSAIQLLFSVYLLLDKQNCLNCESYCNYIKTMRKYAEGQATYEYHLVNCLTHKMKTGNGSAYAACKKAGIYNRDLMYIVFKEINGIVAAPYLFDKMIALFKAGLFDDGN